MRIETDSSRYIWLIFIIWPFSALILALKQNQKYYAKNVFWFFCIYFGYTFAISAESQSSDINSYIDQLQSLGGRDFSISEAWQYYLASGEVDLLRTLLAILVSRFTTSYVALTTVYAAIFGYFFSRNMWFVLEKIRSKKTVLLLLFIAVLFLINPIWNINGFRFNTALHVFLFGLLPFIFNGNKKRLLWCLISASVVHFSFYIPLAVFILYFFIKNKVFIVFCFFLVSFLFGGFNISSLNSQIDSFAPSAFNKRSEMYRGEEKVKLYQSGAAEAKKVWYVRVYSRGLYYILAAILGIFYWFNRKKIDRKSKLSRGLALVFSFYIFSNLLIDLPSGYRFVALTSIISICVLLLFYSEIIQNTSRLLIRISYPFILLFLLVSLRESLYSTSFNTLLGNPVISTFISYDEISLNDLIKSI